MGDSVSTIVYEAPDVGYGLCGFSESLEISESPTTKEKMCVLSCKVTYKGICVNILMCIIHFRFRNEYTSPLKQPKYFP